jgi:hypothetical protein
MEVNLYFFFLCVVVYYRLACLSLKKEADVDGGVIPEAFPEQETGFSESQNGGFLHRATALNT